MVDLQGDGEAINGIVSRVAGIWMIEGAPSPTGERFRLMMRMLGNVMSWMDFTALTTEWHALHVHELAESSTSGVMYDSISVVIDVDGRFGR